MELSFARCLICRGEALRVTGGAEITCRDCQARFPMVEHIPALVRDVAGTFDELGRARAQKPAWYVEAQATEHASPWRHHLARRRRYVQSVVRRELSARGLKRAAHLLDLGCGDGSHLPWLREHADRLYGSDYNIVRLERAGARGTGATLFLSDNLEHAGRDGYFDMIFFNHVIEHIPDDAAALGEVRRLLAPGGILVLGTPNEGSWWWQLAYDRAPHIRASTDHVHFYTVETIAKKLSDAGFRVIESHHMGWGPPDFEWDARLRCHRLLDALFEAVGRTVLPSQAASLYLVATTA